MDVKVDHLAVDLDALVAVGLGDHADAPAHGLPAEEHGAADERRLRRVLGHERSSGRLRDDPKMAGGIRERSPSRRRALLMVGRDLSLIHI